MYTLVYHSHTHILICQRRFIVITNCSLVIVVPCNYLNIISKMNSLIDPVIHSLSHSKISYVIALLLHYDYVIILNITLFFLLKKRHTKLQKFTNRYILIFITYTEITDYYFQEENRFLLNLRLRL